jgi:hypothetical protein
MGFGLHCEAAFTVKAAKLSVEFEFDHFVPGIK